MADDIDSAEEHLRKGHSPFHQVCSAHKMRLRWKLTIM